MPDEPEIKYQLSYALREDGSVSIALEKDGATVNFDDLKEADWLMFIDATGIITRHLFFQCMKRRG